MSFEPVTASLAVGGAALGAFGAYQSGAAQEQAAKYSAQVAREQAGLARSLASADAAEQDRENTDHTATVRAAYGASGFTLDASALDVLESEARKGALKSAMVRYRGELTARGFEQQAALADATARNAGSAKYIGALSTFVSGASRAAGMVR